MSNEEWVQKEMKLERIIIICLMVVLLCIVGATCLAYNVGKIVEKERIEKNFKLIKK